MNAVFKPECAFTGVSLSLDAGLGMRCTFLNGNTFQNRIRNAIPFQFVTQYSNH